jgi:hypothetical protein
MPGTLNLATRDPDVSPAAAEWYPSVEFRPATPAVVTIRPAVRADRTMPTASGGVLQGTRLVLIAFAVLTLLATNQLLVVAAYSDQYFAWTISVRPTSAFLGAAYAAGFVLAVLALRRNRWRDVRVALVTVTVFTVLTLVPTLIHLHTFHLGNGGLVARVAAWFWLAVYVVVPIACLAVVINQQRRPTTGRDHIRRPMPNWLTFLLAVQGSMLLMVGAVLFLGGATVHHFPAEAMSFWPWRLTPLGAQVIGAWLVALAVAAALTIWERDLTGLLVPAATYTAFGAFQLLVLLRYWAQVRSDYPWTWAYVGVLGSIVVTGAYGCWAGRRRATG